MTEKRRRASAKKTPSAQMIAGGALVLAGVATMGWWLASRPGEDADLKYPPAMPPVQRDVSGTPAPVTSVPEAMVMATPSVDQLAKDLGYSNPDAALKDAALLAERVTGGYLPNRWKAECDSGNYSKSLCAATDDYFAPRMDAATGNARRRPRLPSFTVKNMPALQREAFQDLLDRMPDWSIKKLREFAEEALKQEACPRGMSLALARALEREFPEADSIELVRKLDDHGLACLEPKDSALEVNALRAGLIRAATGDTEGALTLLDRAASAEFRREETRVYYWQWRLARGLGRTQKAAEAQKILLTKYPLSWSAILVQRELGIDPLRFFEARPVYRDEFSKSLPTFELRLRWLLLMVRLGNPGLGLTKYGEFALNSMPRDAPAGVVQFFAREMERAGLHRLQILALATLLQGRPESFNRVSLRLMYPRPFFEEFTEAGKKSPLDLALLFALSRQESSFDPSAVSGANARGLFQVLPSTARSISRKAQLNDYVHNIELGARYFSGLVKQFDGSIEKALASYNAGGGNMKKWEARYAFAKYRPEDPQLFVDLIPFRETRDYVSSILRNAYWYHRLYPDFSALWTPQTVTSPLLKKSLAY